MPALEGKSPPVPGPWEANGASGLSTQVMEMLQSMERMQRELSSKIDLQQNFLKTMEARWQAPHVSEGVWGGPMSQPIPSVAAPQFLDDEEERFPAECEPHAEPAEEKQVGWKRSASGSFRIREDADWLTRFAAGPIWSFLCLVLIVVNTAIIGAETQINTQYALGIAIYRQGIGEEVPVQANMLFFQIADVGFLVWMIIEVCVNAYAQRWEFLCGAERWWNFFDVAVVVLSLAMHLLEAVSITFLRVLRLFRMGKILRAFKVIKFMRGVRSMIISMTGSMQHLASACLVMCVFMYTVTLIFMQGISTDALVQSGGIPEPGAVLRRGNMTKAATHHSLSVFEFAAGVDIGTHWEAMEVLYGTIDQAMMTLFLSISSGLTWSLAAEPISKMGTFYGTIWTAFMFFMVFGLLNVLTGIFVDAAIKAMMNDRDNMIAAQIEERESLVKVILGVFQTSDQDGSGMITGAEFETLLMDEELKYYLKAIGIDSDEARHLFKLLDDDNSGMVSIDEFVTGFLRLKGSAKSVDMATLLYDIRKIAKKIDHVSKYTTHLHQGINRLHHATAGGGTGKSVCTTAPEPNVSDFTLSRVLNEISGLLGHNSDNLAQVVPALANNGPSESKMQVVSGRPANNGASTDKYVVTNGPDKVPQLSAIQGHPRAADIVAAKSAPAGAAPDGHDLFVQLERKLLSHVESVAIDCVTIRVEMEQQRQVQSEIRHASMQTAANLQALRNVLGEGRDAPGTARGFIDDAGLFDAKHKQVHSLLPSQDELRVKCLQAEQEVKGLLQTLQAGLEWIEKSRAHLLKMMEAHRLDRQATSATSVGREDTKASAQGLDADASISVVRRRE